MKGGEQEAYFSEDEERMLRTSIVFCIMKRGLFYQIVSVPS